MTGAPGDTSVQLLGAACLAPTPYLSPSPPLSLSLDTVRKQKMFPLYIPLFAEKLHINWVKKCILQIHFLLPFGVKGAIASCHGVYVLSCVVSGLLNRR